MGEWRKRDENRRHLTDKRKSAISWHIKDLLRRDINVAYDCTLWLQPKQRDIDRKARPKRLAARYLAACWLVEADKNPAMATHILDRTEGKVADRLELVDLNKLVEQLEASRQRVISATSEPLPVVVEGEIVEPEDAQPEPISTESATSK